MIELAHAGKTEEYTRRYRSEILSGLNPLEVYSELDNSVLLCWERAGAFCHRRIVADWLENAVGKPVLELDEAEAAAFKTFLALQKRVR